MCTIFHGHLCFELSVFFLHKINDLSNDIAIIIIPIIVIIYMQDLN